MKLFVTYFARNHQGRFHNNVNDDSPLRQDKRAPEKRETARFDVSARVKSRVQCSGVHHSVVVI